MQVQTFSDKAAIGISVFCAIHCITMPLVILSIPSITGWFFAGEHFHQFLIYMIIPTSILALVLGCRKHSQYRVVSLGGIGLTLLIAAAFLLHDLLGQTGEQIVTLIGSCFIASAHWLNYKLCRG